MNDHDRYGGLPGEGFQAGPGQHTLGGFEERLLAAFTREVARRAEASPAAGGPRPQRERATAGAAADPRRWRPALLAATAVAAAGAAAIALVAANGAPAAAPGGAASGPAITAAAVLRHAALAALQTPAQPPKPGQFVYSKILMPGRHGTSAQQQWISADGTRTGLEKSTGVAPGTLPLRGCVNGFVDPAILLVKKSPHRPDPPFGGFVFDPVVVHVYYHPPVTFREIKMNYKRKIHCTPEEFAAYKPDIPTTQAALRRYLNKQHQSRLALALAVGVNMHIRAVQNSVFGPPRLIAGMMINDYLSPQQRAAMYTLLAHTPGLSVLPRVTDMKGTAGIGISVPGKPGQPNILIFNPKTYALLGGVFGGQRWLLAAKAIVNKVGQKP